MSIELSQASRVAKLTTPLGPDVLVASRFDGGEGCSELFEYRIEALGKKESIDFDSAIGQNCTLSIKDKSGNDRHFDGILVEAHWIGIKEDFHAYRLTLKPWLWLLSRTSDCRIFSNMTVPEIIDAVFSENGFNDYEMRLTESYQEREYTVQYRQSSFEFISRLMEEEGIYYYFLHSEGAHTLVLADAKASHDPIPTLPAIPYAPLLDTGRTDEEYIYRITADRRLRSGKVTLNDYDYLQPNASLLCDAQGDNGHAHGEMEVYDYHPGRYTGDTKDPHGERYARVRLESEKALDHRRFAAGAAPGIFPGGLFQLKGHPSEDREYLVLRASHTFVAQHFRSTEETDEEESYFGNYELLPSDRPFRAPRLTERPLIPGPQTAKVVGAQGEEIDVDEHGRILVRFHWDRRSDNSRRVRVAQVWSGKGWGGIVIPRIGQEVVVQFLEGDPDQPLVIGTVYNGENEVPYELPANKTVAGVKSNSSKGGGGYNELKFEDKKGSEEIGVHAQKNLNVVVRNKETRVIGRAFATPEGKESRETTILNGDDYLNVDKGSRIERVGSYDTRYVLLDAADDIGVNSTINVGNILEITAGARIVLSVGTSSIVIDPSGVKITGTAQVQINGGARITQKAGIILINSGG